MYSVGVYVGSFNPFHKGHANIVEKALRIFDEVFIVVGFNPEKENHNTMFSRTRKLDELYLDNPRVTISSNQGLTVDLLKRVKENVKFLRGEEKFLKDDEVSVSLIRGLRDGYDLDYEIKTLRFNQDLDPNINVVMIVCDKEYSHISSTSLRNLAEIGNDLVRDYLP